MGFMTALRTEDFVFTVLASLHVVLANRCKVASLSDMITTVVSYDCWD